MGISCQINLCKPQDGVFYGGESVSGLIKYVIEQPTEFEKIITSLKGIGKISITNNAGEYSTNFSAKEVYVDTDEIIQEGKSKVPAGSYELKFRFMLPEVLPPSYRFKKFVSSNTVDCKIKYYVRIKFDTTSLFSFAKRFQKKITVKSLVTPKLLTEPVIYGTNKKLTQLLATKTSTVAIKAEVLNSVIPPGGKIEVQYEVVNNTNVDIKSVETKLIEVHSFKAELEKVKALEDIPNTVSTTGRVAVGATESFFIEINVPDDKVSFDTSKLVSRDYIVRLTAILPMPHRNVKLDIPVEIGETIQDEKVGDFPPSYWEVMDEEKKDEDNNDHAKGTKS